MNTIAYEFDLKAMGLATDYLRTEGLLLTVLIEMRRRKLFAVLNYSGIFDYCERRLNLSRAQAYYFKTVAEKSEEVPEIKQAVAQGELTLSEARRIVPVLTKENHKEWIEKAKRLPQKELEREVTAANPNAHPVKEKIRPVAKEVSELKVPVDPKTEENLTALKDILSQKLGKPATRCLGS
jgi:polyhydroxyalkanoate synthesis regulator phasin